MSNFVAVRSLQCKDHAHNIPPTVLGVLWNLTKRCNYDCGYCSSFIHDSVSPFVDMDLVDSLISICKRWCGSDRKIKWSITGGEPYLDPNFLNVLEQLDSQPFTEQINTISNGSLPLEKYLQSAKFVAGITFSLHFERDNDELNKIIKKIIAVKEQTDILVSVNVMFLPGQTTEVQKVVNELDQHRVSYIVRLITPLDEEANKIKSYTNDTADRKNIILKSAAEQSQHRQEFKIKNVTRASTNIQNYYSLDELALIEQLNIKPIWHNIGIWSDDNTYQEVNTDQIVSNGKNSFENWICYAGIDSIYIDWDGTIFRGACLNEGPIGHVRDTDIFETNPTICQLTLCQCNHDIPIRKAANVTYLKLIAG
jgi:molybdenum cofactor biosynthesis enzyme MoaA